MRFSFFAVAAAVASANAQGLPPDPPLSFTSIYTGLAPRSVPTGSGSLIALGQSCNATAQCINGAECTVSSAYQEAAAGMVCGPFNATCSSSSQCSYNSCFTGRCIGVQGYNYSTSTAVISGQTTLVAGTAVPGGTGSPTLPAGNVTTNATSTSTLAAFTGAAGKAEAGFAAAVLGAVAFFL